MRKQIITFLTIILITSCQPILRIVTGIKKPEFETYNSIEKYIQENGLPIENGKNYFLTKNDDYKSLSKLRDSAFRLPDIYIFNKRGQFVEENQFCTSLKIELSDNPNENYYDKILKIDSLTSQNKTIHDIEHIMRNSEGQSVEFNKEKNIAIVLWAKFLGKKNKKFLNNANKQLENIKDETVIYFLNIDTLESWEE